MTSFHLADLLESIADTRQDATAVICGERSQSYLELDSRSTRLAHGLVAQGIKAGDHVGIYMTNCIEFIETLYACFKIRAVPININYRYVDDELRYLFTNAELKAVVFQKAFRSRIDVVKDDCSSLLLLVQLSDQGLVEDKDVVDYNALLLESNTLRQFETRDEQDLYVLYTGGTTGMPKGVMWPHRHLFFRALGGGGILGEGPVDSPGQLVERANGGFSTLLCSPLMHGASQWSCLMMLLGGHTVVLSDRSSFDADYMWRLTEKHQVNNLSIVGDAMALPLIDSLVNSIEQGVQPDLSSLFVIGSGGALFSESAQERLKQLLPHIMIFNGFGSSESGVHGRSEKTSEDGLIEIEVTDSTALINDDHQLMSSDSRELGIIAFSGNTPVGYYNDPVKSAETFIFIDDKLWILTGDSGRFTEQGTIVMMGRDSGCINTGGEKVFAEEVESVVKNHPAIGDCLVVGVPDKRFGSRVVALVEGKVEMEFSIEEIQGHCRQSLSDYKIPRDLIVVDQIKREPNGKPNYRWAKTVADTALP